MRGFRICLLFVLAHPFLAHARMAYGGRLVGSLPLAPEERSALAKQAAGAAVHRWPHPAGHRELAALLVDFSDAPADFPPSAIDSILNQPGYSRFGNRGSVRDFYLDFTRGALDLHYQVYGYYRAKQTKVHYETVGNYAGGDELLDEVLKAFDGQVDYSRLGAAGESAVNSVAVLYAGAEHDGDLWGTTSWSDVKVDGRTAGRGYWASIGKSSMEIATFSHEMGHMLFDWPDLYNVPEASGGVGAHSLMGSYDDVHNPIPPDEVLTADQGWIETRDLAAASRGVFPLAVNGPVVYRWQNPARADEAFIIANRANTGRYESLGGKGLLIFHFDFAWNESNDNNKAAITLVQDKGRVKPPSNWAEPPWYFYAANAGEFSYAAQGGDNDWHDGTRSGVRLHSISAPGDTMTFSVGDAIVGLEPRIGGVSRAEASRYRADGTRFPAGPEGPAFTAVKLFSR